MRVVTRPRRLADEVELARREAESRVRRPAPCSASRTSPPAGTSRCRCSPTSTAPCGPSASASARSSAGTRRSSRRRPRRSSSASTACASGCSTPRAAAVKVDRLRRRGHRRVPGRRRGPVLLPRDEHPAAGRAPGHRVHDRPRPGRAADCTSPSGGRLARIRRRRAATRSRPGSTPRTRPRDWQPQSGALHRFAVPGVSAEFAAGDGSGRRPARQRRRRRLGRRRALRPDAGQGDRLGPARDAVRRPCSPTRSPRRASTAWSPTATCWSTCCAIRRSSAGETDTAFFDRRTTSTRWPNPSPTSARQRSLAWPPHLRWTPQHGSSRRCWRGSRPAGATWSASAAVASSTPRTAARSPLPPRAGRACGRRTRRSCPGRRTRRSGRARRRRRCGSHSTSRATATWSASTRPLGPVALRPRHRASSIPASRSRAGSLLAPMPGTVVRLAVAARRLGASRRAAALARGDEDAAPVDAPADGVVAELPRPGRRSRSTSAPSWPWSVAGEGSE